MRAMAETDERAASAAYSSSSASSTRAYQVATRVEVEEEMDEEEEAAEKAASAAEEEQRLQAAPSELTPDAPADPADVDADVLAEASKRAGAALQGARAVHSHVGNVYRRTRHAVRRRLLPRYLQHLRRLDYICRFVFPLAFGLVAILMFTVVLDAVPRGKPPFETSPDAVVATKDAYATQRADLFNGAEDECRVDVAVSAWEAFFAFDDQGSG